MLRLMSEDEVRAYLVGLQLTDLQVLQLQNDLLDQQLTHSVSSNIPLSVREAKLKIILKTLKNKYYVHSN